MGIPTTGQRAARKKSTSGGCKGQAANPCESSNGGCHYKRTCVNNAGSVTCGVCPAGYNNDGAKGCKSKAGTPDVVCDGSKGEIWIGEPKVKDYDACIKSCTDSAKCKSVTFYANHPAGAKGCSHWSTMCKNTKSSAGTLSKNLKGEALNNQECDVSQGEKWLSKTQASDIAACRKSCADEAGCNSFTYYNHGSCSHFSTCCDKTTHVGNAHTERLTAP